MAIDFIKINGVPRADKKEGDVPLSEGSPKQGYVEFPDNNRAACYPYYSPQKSPNSWDFARAEECSTNCKMGTAGRALKAHIYLKGKAQDGVKENQFMTKFEDRAIDGKNYEVFEYLKSDSVDIKDDTFENMSWFSSKKIEAYLASLELNSDIISFTQQSAQSSPYLALSGVPIGHYQVQVLGFLADLEGTHQYKHSDFKGFWKIRLPMPEVGDKGVIFVPAGINFKGVEARMIKVWFEEKKIEKSN